MDDIIVATAIHTPTIHSLTLPFNIPIIASIATESIIVLIVI